MRTTYNPNLKRPLIETSEDTKSLKLVTHNHHTPFDAPKYSQFIFFQDREGTRETLKAEIADVDTCVAALTEYKSSADLSPEDKANLAAEIQRDISYTDNLHKLKPRKCSIL